MSNEKENTGFGTLTAQQKDRNETIIDEIFPEGIVHEGGCPTLEQMAINHNRNEYIANQRSLSKLTKKAREIRNVMLDDMHKVMNPKNVGKVERVYVKNPDFDPTKPMTSTNERPTFGDNPFFIQEIQAVYNPTKYNATTITTTINSVLKLNEELVKEFKQVAQDYKKQAEGMQKEILEAQREKRGEVDIGALISFDDMDGDDVSVN